MILSFLSTCPHTSFFFFILDKQPKVVTQELQKYHQRTIYIFIYCVMYFGWKRVQNQQYSFRAVSRGSDVFKAVA